MMQKKIQFELTTFALVFMIQNFPITVSQTWVDTTGQTQERRKRASKWLFLNLLHTVVYTFARLFSRPHELKWTFRPHPPIGVSTMSPHVC